SLRRSASRPDGQRSNSSRVLYVSAQQRSVCLKRGFHLWTSAQVRQHPLRSNPARYSTNLIAQHNCSPVEVFSLEPIEFDSETIAGETPPSTKLSSAAFGVRPLLDLLESGISIVDPFACFVDLSRIHWDRAPNLLGSRDHLPFLP